MKNIKLRSQLILEEAIAEKYSEYQEPVNKMIEFLDKQVEFCRELPTDQREEFITEVISISSVVGGSYNFPSDLKDMIKKLLISTRHKGLSDPNDDF